MSQLILDLLLNIIAPQTYARNGPETEFTVQIDDPSCTQSNTLAGSQEGHHAGKVTHNNCYKLLLNCCRSE